MARADSATNSMAVSFGHSSGLGVPGLASDSLPSTSQFCSRVQPNGCFFCSPMVSWLIHQSLLNVTWSIRSPAEDMSPMVSPVFESVIDG